MKKLAIIDSVIKCPFYSEGTCFHGPKHKPCDWHQGMKGDKFPKDCPMPNISLIERWMSAYDNGQGMNTVYEDSKKFLKGE